MADLADALENALLEFGWALAGWDEKRTRSAICSLLDRARRAERGEKITWRGKRVDARYRLSGTRVAELLDVSTAEARALHLVYAAAEAKQERKEQAVGRCREKQGVVSRDARREKRRNLAARAQVLMAGGMRLRERPPRRWVWPNRRCRIRFMSSAPPARTDERTVSCPKNAIAYGPRRGHGAKSSEIDGSRNCKAEGEAGAVIELRLSVGGGYARHRPRALASHPNRLCVQSIQPWGRLPR